MASIRPIALLCCFFACSLTSCTQKTVPYQPQAIDVREPKEGDLQQLTPDIAIPLEDPGYTLLLPRDTIKGLAVFFGSGRDTSDAGYEMRFYAEAARRQVATLYVTTGRRIEFLFDADTARYEQLDRYIGQVLDTYPIPRGRLMFMGMSLAGTRAMKFGYWCLDGHSQYNIRPRAIAICDAPLDFFRFWREGAFSIRYNTNPTSANEASWVNAQLEQHLGGTPEEVPEAYRRYSPYVKGAMISPELERLKNVAVRAYTEPDVQWWMANRRKDYYGINALDAAGLANELHLLGNAEAELITTLDKGYRPDGSRHPHSWSIVDNGELVEWFLGL
ncbi:MAG: hypothetical protein KDC66_05195 [Phaeodactylibacter sp.]|nr:hypothetical protein [Phaeodactylibacter sp.]MCB9272931.1 hypothetical protein [Lewinellaceae bacterium]